MRQTDTKPHPAVIERIAKAISQVSNDNDHFALVAARTADRLVRDAGTSWIALLCDRLSAPEPEPPESWAYNDADRPDDLLWAWPLKWRAAIRFAGRCIDALPERERDFVAQLSTYDRVPSERQCGWLRSIVSRLLQKGFVP